MAVPCPYRMGGLHVGAWQCHAPTDGWVTNEIKSGSCHHPIEHAHNFAGATGHRDQFAPGAYFDHAKGVLPQHVRSHVVFGANDQNREMRGSGLIGCSGTGL